MRDVQIKSVRIHLRTAVFASSTRNGCHLNNPHIHLYLSKKFLLDNASRNGSQKSLGDVLVDMKEVRLFYGIEFGHFSKQLVNFHYYVTFSVIVYKYLTYDIHFHFFSWVSMYFLHFNISKSCWNQMASFQFPSELLLVTLCAQTIQGIYSDTG
jgi:hypothetical protein